MERKNEKRKIYIYTPLVDTAHIYIYTGIQREMVFFQREMVFFQGEMVQQGDMERKNEKRNICIYSIS
jgi:hypothetical protein